jgi:hypothetical protein
VTVKRSLGVETIAPTIFALADLMESVPPWSCLQKQESPGHLLWCQECLDHIEAIERFFDLVSLLERDLYRDCSSWCHEDIRAIGINDSGQIVRLSSIPAYLVISI